MLELVGPTDTNAEHPTFSELRAGRFGASSLRSLAPENFIPIGYGKRLMKNAAYPFGRENRRVLTVRNKREEHFYDEFGHAGTSE